MRLRSGNRTIAVNQQKPPLQSSYPNTRVLRSHAKSPEKHQCNHLTNKSATSTPRNADGSFRDIGHLIASIPSAAVRNQIFSYLDNRTKLRLLPLFKHARHRDFLYSSSLFWQKVSLRTNRKIFRHLTVLTEFLPGHVQKIYLNSNVYYDEYCEFLKMYDDCKNRGFVEFLKEKCTSFDNYDVMFLDKLDGIYRKASEFDDYEHFDEEQYRWLAIREYTARISEVHRNFSISLPKEIVDHYISELALHSSESIEQNISNYREYDKVALSKQYKIWTHIEQVELHMYQNVLFKQLDLFAFKHLKAMHLFGGFLRNDHGKPLSEMEHLENFSIYGEYVICPYFDEDTFRMYTQSPMLVTNQFFEPFSERNRRNLKYLEYVDYSPIEDYEILEVWSADELEMFADILDRVNLRATYYSAEVFGKYLAGALGAHANSVHICTNAVILTPQTIDILLKSCPVLEELSLKHCVDCRGYLSFSTEYPRGYAIYTNDVLLANQASFQNMKKLQLRNMFFDAKSLYTVDSFKTHFPNIAEINITCKIDESKMVHESVKRLCPRVIQVETSDPRYGYFDPDQREMEDGSSDSDVDHFHVFL